MKYEKIRKQVLDAILDAVDQGLIHGTSGNIAMRDDEDDVVAITPSGISYTGMTAEDIAIVDPVSYTHLDVYKRQGSSQFFFLFRQGRYFPGRKRMAPVEFAAFPAPAHGSGGWSAYKV